MIHFALCPPIAIGAELVTTLKEAAYTLRQYAIRESDDVAWSVVHALRDAETRASAEAAACQLRAWSDLHRFSKSSEHRRNGASGFRPDKAYGIGT